MQQTRSSSLRASGCKRVPSPSPSPPEPSRRSLPHRSLNSVFRKHYWCMTPNQKQARSRTVLLGRTFPSSALGDPLPQFPHLDCTAVWTLVLGFAELGGTGACAQLTCLLAAWTGRGGRGRWPRAGRPQATVATGRAQGPAPGTSQGGCHTLWQGSGPAVCRGQPANATTPSTVFAQSRGSALASPANVGDYVSSCYCWGEKKNSNK